VLCCGVLALSGNVCKLPIVSIATVQCSAVQYMPYPTTAGVTGGGGRGVGHGGGGVCRYVSSVC
jgi:hypothetical protein